MSHFGFPEQHREDAAPSRHWPGPDSAPAGSCPIESPLLSSSTSSFDQPPGDQAPRLMLLLDQFDHDTSLSLSLMQRRAEHLKRDLELTFQSKLRALARFRDITLAELLEAQGDPARALQRRVSRRMRQMAEQARAELPQPAERPDALAASDPAPPMGSPSLAGPGTTSPSPPGHASRRQVDMSNPSAPAQSNRRATMTFSPATIRQSWRASVARASTASLDEMSAVRCRKTTLPAGGAPAARRLPSALEEDSSFQPEILTLSSRRLREASLTPLDTPAPLLRSRSSLAPAVGQSPPLRPVALPSRAGLYNRHSSRPSLSLARPTMSPRRTSLSAGGRPPTRHTMAPSHGMAAQKASLSIGSRSTAALPRCRLSDADPPVCHTTTRAFWKMTSTE
ncbi:hypothetical protein H696_00150 [Fonticula alba]|uniref:Uncharacterized protein n=1 Tax=Fonticula alba TaxID=691883 RepID=A0A058ZDX2_FONAL|nr:hypothetical protein H696_00150 [Fonticula alba]KCV72559.1 hypothetical protein H696_00150 [Fonticula alba]|eukprot:XP_009492260.1 hypothetical protein H696_00150 [Fonticula alba]